jgi:hypothetical protein
MLAEGVEIARDCFGESQAETDEITADQRILREVGRGS